MQVVQLSPEPIDLLFRGIVLAGRNSSENEAGPAYPGRRRFHLFRQSVQSRWPDRDELRADCHRLLQARAPHALFEDGSVPDPEGIFDLEERFGARDPSYRPGHFLSLVRLGLDVVDTARTDLTAVERRSFHLLRMRLLEIQRSERPADPESMEDLLLTLRRGAPAELRQLADLLRYLDEVTHHPLLGWPQLAALDSLHLLIALQHTARICARRGVVDNPLMVCLGARSVLANARIHHLRVGALLDLVLSPEQPLWDDLLEWMAGVPPHEQPQAFPLPGVLSTPLFSLEDGSVRPLDLVFRVAHRILESGKGHSASSSLVALERTLYRRIYRQEGHKHTLVVALRRHFEKALRESHRKALRLVRPPTDALAMPSTSAFAREESNAAWDGLLERVESLERSRWSGHTPSGLLCAERLLTPDEALLPGQVSDLEEFLRWNLDCRGDLWRAVRALAPERRAHLVAWFRALRSRASAHDGDRRRERERLGKRPVSHWSPTTPLQWIALADSLNPGLADLSDPPEILDTLEPRLRVELLAWQARMPWEQRLFGVWPARLRGELFAAGLRPGALEARRRGEDPERLSVHLDLLESELEFRTWLGARERRTLFRATLEEEPDPL